MTKASVQAMMAANPKARPAGRHDGTAWDASNGGV